MEIQACMEISQGQSLLDNSPNTNNSPSAMEMWCNLLFWWPLWIKCPSPHSHWDIVYPQNYYTAGIICHLSGPSLQRHLQMKGHRDSSTIISFQRKLILLLLRLPFDLWIKAESQGRSLWKLWGATVFAHTEVWLILQTRKAKPHD